MQLLREVAATLSRGDPAAAAALIDAALAGGRDDAALHDLRAVCALRLGDDAAARRSAEAAIQRAPQSHSPQLNAGSACLHLGDLDAAQRHFDSAHALAPNNAAALRGLARCAERQGDWRRARNGWRSALALGHDATVDGAGLLRAAARLVSVGGAPREMLVLPADLPSLAFVICSIDPAREARVRASIERHFAAWPQHQVVVMHDARSLAEAYNRGIDSTDSQWLVFCHDDIEFLPQDFAARLRAAMDRFDVVGVAGSRRCVGPAALWGGPAEALATIAYPQAEGVLVTVAGSGARHEPAQILDGVFIAARRPVTQSLRFDAERFDGFHLYDIDFSLAASRQGFRVGVAQDLHLLHASMGRFDERWQVYSERFAAKYPDLPKQPAHRVPSAGQLLPDAASAARVLDELHAD